jgi:hypothetical protein
MELAFWLLLGLLLLLVPIVGVVGLQLWGAVKTKKAPDYDSEDYFIGPNGCESSFATPRLPTLRASDLFPVSHTMHLIRSRGRFPKITDAPTLLVSVVVPAYKEEKRISKMMDEMLATLRQAASRDK